MNAAFLALLALVGFLLGYRFYSRFLAEKVFGLSKIAGKTPAHTYRDDIDYVPARRAVLFGHHYASIAGAAPIVGPAVAVIWGWLPALIWVVLGTVFMGAAHDFGALVLSMRHRGQSIGKVCEEVIGPRSKLLFSIVIFFLLWMVIAVFALVIANLFISFPSSVLPVNFQIVVALTIGWLINRQGQGRLLAPSFLALAALLGMMILGSHYPISIRGIFGEHEMMAWVFFLMIYSYIASVLPVWLLLQPRDFINSHQLFLGLGALLVGLFVSQPQVVAPAFNPTPIGAPSWFPFLFITIACGAISGFHGLVSSGTSSKQVNRWKDARAIGYGGMLGEGLLALLAVLAATAGFSSSEQWHHHYSDWNSANGLSAKLNAFVLGASRFLQGAGIPEVFGKTAISVMIISFAATSLDTAVRIQRYVVAEFAQSFKLRPLQGRHPAALFAVGTAFLLMVAKGGGKGGLMIWPLFGATNQMLAALTLTVISIFLVKNKKPSLPYLIPVGFMVIITALGLIMNTRHFYVSGSLPLAILAACLFVVQLWIVVEGAQTIRRLG